MTDRSGGLEGRVAVVTGGGRGIGAAVARRLAASGAAVVVASRTGAEVAEVAGSIEGAGGRAWAVECDVTDEASVASLAESARARAGGSGAGGAGAVDILVNNAGAAGSAPLREIGLAEWNRLLAVNATSAFLCARALVPGMVESGWGRVVNVASVAGLHGARYIAAYTASKHAMVGLTRALAAEVAGRGVTVNAVCPDYVDTAMTDESVARIVARTGRTAEEARTAIVKSTRLGRLIRPEEVADAVAYLCGEGAAGVNGHMLVLDGGTLQW